ncbi:MAG: 1-acyl-sn-glycerol-3-phosphate acyltransferase [Acidimicrobiia bacterium]|nr:1-acyl-sn-glycerol-3-phosphate acyltransferase [Acidimicrobiia bacterium]
MAERWTTSWRVVRPFATVLSKLGFRMRVEGAEYLPRSAAVLAANHYSFLDPPLVGFAARTPIRFLAVHSLWGMHPLFDKLIEVFGAVPLRNEGRPVRAMRLAINHLRDDGVVGIFPEGQRVNEFGDEAARRGAAWLAWRTGAPLIPIYIHGSEWALSLRNPAFRFIPVAIHVGAPIDPSDHGPGRDALETMTGEWESRMRALRDAARRETDDGAPHG